MYSTSKNLNPSKPVITSLTQANHDLEQWLKENDHSHLIDADGLRWTLTVTVYETPAKDDHRRRDWEITFKIAAKASGQEFIETGTLDVSHDERLLALLGNDTVPLHMKPYVVMAHSLEEARSVFAQTIQDLRKRLGGQSLHDTKRQLIARYIDDLCRFK